MDQELSGLAIHTGRAGCARLAIYTRVTEDLDAGWPLDQLSATARPTQAGRASRSTSTTRRQYLHTWAVVADGYVALVTEAPVTHSDISTTTACPTGAAGATRTARTSSTGIGCTARTTITTRAPYTT